MDVTTMRPRARPPCAIKPHNTLTVRLLDPRNVSMQAPILLALPSSRVLFRVPTPKPENLNPRDLDLLLALAESIWSPENGETGSRFVCVPTPPTFGAEAI